MLSSMYSALTERCWERCWFSRSETPRLRVKALMFLLTEKFQMKYGSLNPAV